MDQNRGADGPLLCISLTLVVFYKLVVRLSNMFLAHRPILNKLDHQYQISTHPQGFLLVAMRTLRPSPKEASLMGAPSLSGRVSAVIWLQRSNAVTHLKRGLRYSGERS